MQVQRVQNNNTNFTFSGLIQGLTLKNEIAKLKNPTKEMVRDMYGTFGLDIFEGKEHLTILSDKEFKKSKGIISKIRTWFTGNALYDFEDGDTLADIVFKFMGNKKSGLVKDIETKFGKKGLEQLNRFARMGYANL